MEKDGVDGDFAVRDPDGIGVVFRKASGYENSVKLELIRSSKLDISRRVRVRLGIYEQWQRMK